MRTEQSLLAHIHMSEDREEWSFSQISWLGRAWWTCKYYELILKIISTLIHGIIMYYNEDFNKPFSLIISLWLKYIGTWSLFLTNHKFTSHNFKVLSITSWNHFFFVGSLNTGESVLRWSCNSASLPSK